MSGDGLHSYVLQTGTSAEQRLAMLDRLTWPTTEPLLQRCGIERARRVLDVGCASGRVTMRMAALVDSSCVVSGIDLDEAMITVARASAEREGLPIGFSVRSVESLGEDRDEPHDFVYVRFVLSHCSDPDAALAAIVAATAPGGTIVLEDVHFPGSFCSPPNDGYQRYLDLYEVAARARGGDPRLGPRLPAMLRAAGLEGVGFDAHVPTFSGPEQIEGLRFAAITLAAIADSVVDAGLAPRDDVDAAVTELERFAKEPGAVMSIVRICQSWGTKPS